MYLIGITGKKHSGKDEVCKLITELLAPRKVERIAFADKLKEEIAKEFKTTVEYINQNKDRFRKILQEWGQLKRELIRPDYWIWEWGKKVNNVAPSCFLIIATDVRYLNEEKMIKDIGGRIVRVSRPNPGNIFDPHSSETEQDAIKHDFYVPNNGTLTDLRQMVSQTLVDIRKTYINGYEYANSKDGTKAGIIHSTRM